MTSMELSLDCHMSRPTGLLQQQPLVEGHGVGEGVKEGGVGVGVVERGAELPFEEKEFVDEVREERRVVDQRGERGLDFDLQLLKEPSRELQL